MKLRLQMPKKKILYIHHGKGIGGAPLSLRYLIENLDKQKYHPIVLFLHYSEVVDLYKSKGIEVVDPISELDFPHTKIWWLRWYHFPFFLKILWSSFKTLFFVAPFWLKKIKPDLIHLNTSSLIAWGKAASKLKIPVIWHIREPLASGYFGIRKKIVQKFVEKYATKILPICKNDAKPWEKNSKTNVVYNAVDLNLFDPKIINKIFLKNFICPKILFLGGLSKEKGTLLIFKVFEKLLQKLPSAKLIVAGYFYPSTPRSLTKFGTRSFPLRRGFAGHVAGHVAGQVAGQVRSVWRNVKKFFPAQKFQKDVNQILRGIKKNIIFLGPIKNVPQVMAECDVLVFPATVGHFARPVIEASCMGKPVVASNLSPLNELVIDGKTGFLINPNEINLWAEKLYQLLTDKELNRNIGRTGFDFATKKFDVKLQIQIIEKIYSGVLGELY